MQPESMRTAFVGLGVMGYPMAGFLAQTGHETTVYNRTASKAEKWLAEYGGSSANTPRKAATGADIVFCCVGNDDDVRDVILGEDGALNGVERGAIIVDHTTASASIAREIHAAAAAKGVGFLDAPVSGGQAGAENGQLTVMVGGDADVFDRAAPVIDCYAKAITPTQKQLPASARSAPVSWQKWLTRSASRASYRACRKGCISRNVPAWIPLL
jgi:3-hydroxyisobutyrate dehydrogenase-like beta-hydroxyacid dehydrogenase